MEIINLALGVTEGKLKDTAIEAISNLFLFSLKNGKTHKEAKKVIDSFLEEIKGYADGLSWYTDVKNTLSYTDRSGFTINVNGHTVNKSNSEAK